MDGQPEPEHGHVLVAGLWSGQCGRSFALTFLALLAPILVPFEKIANVTAVALALASTVPAIRSADERPTVRNLVRLVALVLIAATIALEAGDYTRLVGWVLVAVGTLYFVAPVMILRNVARHETITGQSVFGAVAMYLQIGIAFAFVYSGLDRAVADSFSLGGVDSASWPTYFSFVTLTTLGYGDITPSSQTTESLAILEAVLGQILLVTVVARLVSLLGSQGFSSTDEP
ncbi:MAG: hypothetical protein JJLCMIEE_00539 [Acidimicrobiales bacterium]|nr:MAG: two pore domain potassium channel family protein [Actinomycetota bacterium]MBV6507491.1 hypothetical protein [Acidimicrobiales bacterium]RIK07868.1 MAG: hypothetical protein DCC48_02645 [Acidobacteriota bacterium]